MPLLWYIGQLWFTKKTNTKKSLYNKTTSQMLGFLQVQKNLKNVIQNQAMNDLIYKFKNCHRLYLLQWEKIPYWNFNNILGQVFPKLQISLSPLSTQTAALHGIPCAHCVLLHQGYFPGISTKSIPPMWKNQTYFGPTQHDKVEVIPVA